jgi:hypothetical protein
VLAVDELLSERATLLMFAEADLLLAADCCWFATFPAKDDNRDTESSPDEPVSSPGVCLAFARPGLIGEAVTALDNDPVEL